MTHQMTDRLKIAALQHAPQPGNLQAALDRIDDAAKHAAADGCDLLLLPECSVTGYNQPQTKMQQMALEENCTTSNAIKKLCIEHQIAISYGYAERVGSSFFNTVALADANGSVVGKYHKTHLWGDLDRKLFDAGNSLSSVFEFKGWQLAFAICYDIEFPETSRALALQGAELLLVPTGLMQPWREVAERVVPVRAYESQVFIAYCNYTGAEADIIYEGRSCIAGPDGVDLARADQSEVMIMATIDKSALQQARSALPYHRDRRPELYGTLLDTPRT